MISSQAAAVNREDIVKQLREGQLAQAAKLVAEARKSQPKDLEMWFLEGVVQAQSGQTDKAITTFTQITQVHPQHAESFNNLGVLVAAKGQLNEARAYFEKALRTNPSYAAVHKNLGDVNSQLAKTAYSKALLVDPKVKPAAVQLSMLASTSSVAAGGEPVTAQAEPVTSAAPTLTVKSDPAPAATISPQSSPPAAVPPQVDRPVTAQTSARKTEDKSIADDAIDRQRVEEALRAWAKAWSKKDMGQYLAAYATSFDPPGNMSRKAWEEERRVRIVGKRTIRVDVSQFRIRIKGDQAQAQFVQQYDSDSFKGRSTKNLSLVKEKGRWLISSESAKPL